MFKMQERNNSKGKNRGARDKVLRQMPEINDV